jgi:hypothetical protein
MIPPLFYLERYRNEGTRAYSPLAAYTEAEERFRPDSLFESFELPTFQIPLEELNVYEANAPSGLRDAYVGGDHARFVVHPQILHANERDVYLERVLSFEEASRGIRVSPSSSTRTLYVLDGAPAHALKVHFPFQVSRYGRRMRDEVVEQAVQVSGWLQDGIGAMDDGFAFFREVLGITLKNLEPGGPRAENWGFLIRELQPFPGSPSGGPLVPGFALYGRDFFEPTRAPLLFDLTSGRDPAGFVLDEVFLPVIRQWVACFLNFGLILEPHGQNVLLELDSSQGVERIVHRDLNVGIDNRRLRDLGLPTDSHNSYNRMESGEFASIAYDKFMGGHFFDSVLAMLVEEDPGLNPRRLVEPCRDAFAEAFPDHEKYLPRTIQYFSDDRDRFGKPLFRDTGEKPRWRP